MAFSMYQLSPGEELALEPGPSERIRYIGVQIPRNQPFRFCFEKGGKKSKNQEPDVILIFSNSDSNSVASVKNFRLSPNNILELSNLDISKKLTIKYGNNFVPVEAIVNIVTGTIE